MILAIDFGSTRTGLAIARDKKCPMATPLETIVERDMQKLVIKISNIANNLAVEKIILGLPKNMDGSEGFSAKKVRDFQQELSSMLQDIPIILYDERCTTLLAHQYMNDLNKRGEKRKKIIDCISAVLILEDYIKNAQNDFK